MTTFLSLRPNFFVSDLERSTAFYRDVLGFTVTMHTPQYGLTTLEKDAGSIALIQTSKPVNIPQVPGIAEAYIYVTDLKTVHAACATAQAISTPVTQRPWGLTDFVVQDPDGRLIAIGEQTATTTWTESTT